MCILEGPTCGHAMLNLWLFLLQNSWLGSLLVNQSIPSQSALVLKAKLKLVVETAWSCES